MRLLPRAPARGMLTRLDRLAIQRIARSNPLATRLWPHGQASVRFFGFVELAFEVFGEEALGSEWKPGITAPTRTLRSSPAARACRQRFTLRESLSATTAIRRTAPSATTRP